MNKPYWKTMQPCDAYEDKIKYPCIVQPKIDGVSMLNQQGNAIGRSLKPLENKYTIAKYSKPEYDGICGELIVGTDPCAQDLCRSTSQAVRTREGSPKTTWWVFDYVTEDTKYLPYIERYLLLCRKVIGFENDVRVVPNWNVFSHEELLSYEEKCLDEGYEGVIIRDPDAEYKNGRCSKTHMGAWRIKRFIDAEIRVTEIIEGQANNNEAVTNARGLSERPTNAEGMQANGKVGAIVGTLLQDVLDRSDKLLFSKGEAVQVGAGKMSHQERKFYFENQHELLGKMVKFKMFPIGVKDKPRFPTFECIRNEDDV